jgi:MFS family permease
VNNDLPATDIPIHQPQRPRDGRSFMEEVGEASGASKQGPLDSIYRKIRWRLMPLLLVAQIFAYLDRINIGTAKLQMAVDLNFSAAVYGFGAGVFFIGYFVFEVPSNILLHRYGARAWIARIMVSWGLLSGATVFVHSATGFYVQRFLLGIAEAGFFPGVVLYLTYWFPAQRRGRMTTLFMTATAVSGVIGGPLSAWIMVGMNGYKTLEGWRWMFLLEAAPAVVLGLLVFLYLPSKPRGVTWLTTHEQMLLERDITAAASTEEQGHGPKNLFTGSIALFAAIYFLLLAGLYGVSFWLPSLIKAAGTTDTYSIGLLSAIPYAVAVIVMNVVAFSADRSRQWAKHVGLSAIFAALGFWGSVHFAAQVEFALACLSISAAGILSALPLFWSLPTERLTGAKAAAGIALINAIGNLSGFVSPFAIGLLTEITHQSAIGIELLGASMALAGILTLAYGRSRERADR